MGTDRRPFAPLGWVFVALSVFLAAVAVQTAARNRSLARELAETQQARLDDYSLQVGSQAPDLSGWGPDGKALRLAPAVAGGGATVVLVFTPTCPVCASNWPAWNSLADRLRGIPATRVVAVNLRGRSSEGLVYETEHRLQRFTYLAKADESTIGGFRMRFVPQTLLLDASGTVRYSRAGPLRPEHVREIAVLAERASRRPD